MANLGFPAGSNPSVLGPALRVADAVQFEDDFVGLLNASNTVNAAKWYSAGVGTEVTTTESSDYGGAATLQTGTSANDSCGIRSAAAFTLAANRSILGMARLKVGSTSNQAAFFGLAASISNNNVCSKLVLNTLSTDCIGFYINGTSISIVTGNGGTSNTPVAATAPTGATTPVIAATTYVDLAFEVIGTSKVNFYFNGYFCGTLNTYLPTNPQAVTFDVQTTTTAAKTITVDYVNVVAGR